MGCLDSNLSSSLAKKVICKSLALIISSKFDFLSSTPLLALFTCEADATVSPRLHRGKDMLNVTISKDGIKLSAMHDRDYADTLLQFHYGTLLRKVHQLLCQHKTQYHFIC